MPIERLAYSCKFKCGKNVVLRFKSMESHEERCLKNPLVKSCVTCKHDIDGDSSDYEIGYPGHPGECALDARGDKKCITGCNKWEATH